MPGPLLSDHLPFELADDVPDWFEMCEPLEGRIYGLYLDVKGLVTTGVGNLRDTLEQALGMPWRLSDPIAPLNAPADPSDSLATDGEIKEAWEDIKGHQLLRSHGARAALARNRLRLTRADVDQLVIGQLIANERILLRDFPDWRSFPADAQLGLMSHSWAVGAGFARSWPLMAGAVRRQDWAEVARHSHLEERGNAGVIERNRLQRHLFANAAQVAAQELDCDVLYWPLELSAQPDSELS